MTTSTPSPLRPSPLTLVSLGLLVAAVAVLLGAPLVGVPDDQWWRLDGRALDGRDAYDAMGLGDGDVPALTYAMIEASAGGAFLTSWLLALVAGARRLWARIVVAVVLVVLAAVWMFSLGETYPRTGPGGASAATAYWTVAVATVVATWLLVLAIAMVADLAPGARPLVAALLPAGFAVLWIGAIGALMVAVPGLVPTPQPVLFAVSMALCVCSCALWAVPRRRA